MRSFAHMWPLVTSDKFVLETVSRGYRIEFTAKPPTTLRVWWKETPKNLSRRADLERGLQSMLDKQAIREIPVSPETPGFYSPIFLVAKESGGWRPILNLKAFNKFVVPPSFWMETLRTVMDCLGEAAQQRQHLRTFDGLKSVRKVGDLYRFKRRLLSRDRGARAYQVPTLRLQRQSLWVPGAPLRSVDGSQSLHKDREGHRGLPQSTRCRYEPVLGRLADENQSKSLVEHHRDLTLFWVNKLGFLEGKSQLTPTQAPAFLGPVSPEYARVPERKEDSQGYPPSGLFAGENCPASEDLAEVSRTPVQPPRVGSYGGSPHAADPADAPRPVDTGLGQPVRTHPPERGDSCRVVDVTGQSSSWPPLPGSRSDYVDRNRCLQGRIGRPPRQLGGLRALVKSLGQATHQLARASSGLANPEAFPTSVAGHCCGCHFRQFHHGCLYQQGGRDPVPVSVPSGTGRLGMVQATRHLSCGQPPVLGQERPCGCLVQGEPPSSDGVDPPQRGDQSDLSTLANPSCGPVRIGEEPQAASVLLNPAVPVIERCERADAELGMPLPICVSTNGTRPESVAEVEASTDGAVLAQPAVVPPTDVDADGSAAGDLPEGRSPEECGTPNRRRWG